MKETMLIMMGLKLVLCCFYCCLIILVVIVISVLAGVNKITTHLGFIGWCEKSFSCETHESDVEFENSK